MLTIGAGFILLFAMLLKMIPLMIISAILMVVGICMEEDI